MIKITIPKWNIQEMTGYEPKTTFWDDFSIADKFGPDAVADTFKRAFNEWKKNIEYLTELSLVLNHKIFQWYEKNDRLAELYNKLWREVDDYAYGEGNLSEKERDYYFQITD